ncbi:MULTISPECIES: type II CAAX endopeptidase family protein [unclassified Roseofilum]|uniref:CPBP family intramembrane glutamic endopeptidase n=1 Tax=unclassified Roseofilum TaxID=2620099 RepID=UPI001B18614D|nr:MULTISPECIES: type II CAAX endopeptidase family protein [unclassified Roseofilum]MBP0009673.1 CPBP family intramembrane metalloprotease [Roseofilum sp. Belize Diploria]MBP0035800.1 CPBP family intramembrane metalloprotease [Roseofilum sp. Belize BBD 4]
MTSEKQPLTIKQIGLLFLTAIALSLIALFLYNSWSQPQFQGQLELYQTNLLLNSSVWKGENLTPQAQGVLRQTLIGVEPVSTAISQYEDAQKDSQNHLEKTRQQLTELNQQPVANLTQETLLKQAIASTQESLEKINLNLGLLKIQADRVPEALQLWQKLADDPQSFTGDTAQALIGLWEDSPQILSEAPLMLDLELSGWFRYQALSRLYEIQGDELALRELETQQQEIAFQGIRKLLIVAGVQSVGIFLGTALLVLVVLQWIVQRKESWLSQNQGVTEVPWNWDTILLVLVAGFFFIGQLISPVIFREFLSLFSFTRGSGVRADALIILMSYLVSSAGALGILYVAVNPFKPLPQNWFKFDIKASGIVWGIGGFLIAIPVVLLVSLINQILWQGQGGSNPILPLALQGNDWVAIACFAFTASVAAPVFEEIMFRGFLLPSLTRYVPVWLAITLSGFVFAIAHLSLSEIIPLATLGIIMGIVYTRSGNLLAPIVLHSLWNGNTLLSLFLLGSSLS